MATWATQRQLRIFGGLFGVVMLAVGAFLFSVLYNAPSCVDGKLNQKEDGIDCGGPCTTACPANISPLFTLWSRVIPAGEGAHDALAFLENPNAGAGITRISYLFKLFDAENLLVARGAGATFVNPNERFYVYEGNIRTGNRVPTRAFLEFEPDPEWQRETASLLPIVVRETLFEETETGSQLKAVLSNVSFEELRGVTVTAVLFDDDENVFAASETRIDVFPAEKTETIFFTWRRKFDEFPARVDVLPRRNIFVAQ